MSDNPKVAVVVPVFNAGHLVRRALTSLLEQSMGDLEIIAVNDASTDESTDILTDLATRDSRLCVIELGKNVGVHEARAAGVKVSRAPWIGFLDADDLARPEMFQTLYQAAVESNADVTVCGSVQVSVNRRRIRQKVRIACDELIEEAIFDRFCQLEFGTAALWNKLYRRELILSHATTSFRWRQDATEDTIVNIGCFLDAKRIRLLPAVLHEYVLNSDSATQSADAALGYVRMLRAFAAASDLYHHRGESVLLEIANLYKKQLGYECYSPNQIEELLPYKQELGEAVRVLADRNPIGLSLLASFPFREMDDRVSLRSALKVWGRLTAGLPKRCFSALNRRLDK